MARMTTTYTKLSGLNRALRQLPKEASGRLKQAARGIAGLVADSAASKARSEGGIAALVAPTLRPANDRVPLVRMGSAQRLPESGDGWERDRSGPGQTIGDVIWGAEFGGGRRATTRQFEPWRGSGDTAGYFLWPTVRAKGDEIGVRYSEALKDALEAIG